MPADVSYPDSEIAHLIRSARIKLGLSQARLGAAVDRTATTVRRWERGDLAPDEDLLPALAEALEVDPALLLHALRGPDKHVIIPAPPGQPSGPVAEVSDTSVSGAAAAASLDTSVPALTPVAKVDARPMRPGISLVPVAPTVATGSVEKAPGPALGAAGAVPAPASPAAGDARPPARGWIDVSREQMPAVTPAEEMVVPIQPISRATSLETTQKVAPAVARPAPPQPAIVPAVGWRQLPSYLEDPRERWRYILRGILTAVILIAMAYVALWAAGELLDALDAALDLFSDPDDLTTTTTLLAP